MDGEKVVASAGGVTEIPRSSRREVRNPVLALPAARQLAALDAPSRAALEAVLRDLRQDARERAELAWRRGKGPLAVYWRAVSTYAGHLARAVRVRQ